MTRVALDAAAAGARARLPHIGGVVVAVLAAATPLVRDLGLGASARVAADVALFALWLASVAAATWMGLAATRLDDAGWMRVARGDRADVIAIARTLGALGFLAAWAASVTAAYAVLATTFALPVAGTPTWGLLLLGELFVVCTLASALRVALPPVPAAFATAGLWWVGHLTDELASLAASGRPAATWVRLVVPDLDRFDGHTALIHGVTLPTAEVAVALAGAAAWTVALGGITAWATARRGRA